MQRNLCWPSQQKLQYVEYMANQPSVKPKLSVISSNFTKKGKFQSQVVIGTICSTGAHSAALAIGGNSFTAQSA
jgi:hypothetical protein